MLLAITDGVGDDRIGDDLGPVVERQPSALSLAVTASTFKMYS